MKRITCQSGLCLFVAFLFLPGLVSARADTVLLAIAANFTDASKDIIQQFEQISGHTVKASYGSTGKLFAQIDNAAPFDVFLSADEATAVKAETAGLAVAGTRFTYARGKLVLWSAKPTLFNNGEQFLKDNRYAHLAIANPQTAPYGAAAQQVLQHIGIWSAVQNKLVQGDSIAQAFQFVATQNAEVGFVAGSQAIAWKTKGSVWEVPAQFYAPIIQQAVLLKRGENNPAAKLFLEFLKSDQAKSIISQHGYGID